MKYLFAKIFLVAFCSIFIVIGLGAIVMGTRQDNGAVVFYIFGAIFLTIATTVLVSRFRQLTRFQTMTYDWYRATYPANVQPNRVSCFSCGSNRINARALMNRTFHREHFCVQCGKALYYSPE
jgi:hypothetical protein